MGSGIVRVVSGAAYVGDDTGVEALLVELDVNAHVPPKQRRLDGPLRLRVSERIVRMTLESPLQRRDNAARIAASQRTAASVAWIHSREPSANCRRARNSSARGSAGAPAGASASACNERRCEVRFGTGSTLRGRQLE